jgi:eukaryotic-like serine/threonine-protein kinase
MTGGRLVDSLAFLEQLKQSRLLGEEKLAEVRRRHSFLLPMHELAGRLQAEGVLTTYQCKQIAAGRAKDLVLGKYRISDELGRGGFGEVYKALHTVMNRTVAIKVIAPERVADSRARDWFRREQEGVAKLHHPNIAMSYDADEEDGKLYFVMEFVDGPNLHRLVAQKGPLAVPMACEMLRQSGLALQYAHENGFLHRDIKPANLLIPKPIAGREGRGIVTPTLVKVVDFGLARLPSDNFQTLMLGEKGLMGTPDYMAPEQARDHHHADIRSDLYSLGCSFYFALSGRRPFVGSSLTELISQHLSVEAQPLGELRAELPAGLVNVIRRLMEKKPEDRYQTPAEMITAVEMLCETRAANLEPISLPEPEQAEAQESVAATRVVAHLAFADGTADIAGPKADAASRVLEIDEVDASTADPEATSGTVTDVQQFEPNAVPTEPEPVDSGEPVAIADDVRLLWEEWTALVESMALGKRRHRIKETVYQQLHRSLLDKLRAPEEDAGRRRVHQRMESIVAPWMSLGTFAQTDRLVLQSLWTRARQLEDSLVPWRSSLGWARWMAIACLLLFAVAVATQFSQVPGLAYDPHWSWKGAWRWVQQNPLLSLGIFSPVVALLTAVLVTRSRRFL